MLATVDNQVEPMERHSYNAQSLSAALREFEKTYGLTTEAFYVAYCAGDETNVPIFDRQVWASFHEDVMRLNGDGDGDVMRRVGRVFATA